MREITRRFKVWALYAATIVVTAIAIFYSTVPFLRTDGRSDNLIPKLKEMSKPKEYSYSVTMSPMGTVYFDHVPKKVLTGDSNYNEILAATRDADKIVRTSYLHHRYDGFYNEIPGFKSGLNWDLMKNLADSSGRASFDKEYLYALKAEVHHLDPLVVMQSKGWTPEDVIEVSQNVGPFFANRGSRDFPPGRPKIAPYSTPIPEWQKKQKGDVRTDDKNADGEKKEAGRKNADGEKADAKIGSSTVQSLTERKAPKIDPTRLPGFEDYEVYSLWELSDKVAQVYKKQEVVAKIKAMSDKMAAEIQAKLPPKEKQPRVGLLFYGRNHFTPYKLYNGGYGQAQYHVVQAQDAFDQLDCYGNGMFQKAAKRSSAAGNATSISVTTVLEALVACNPDVIIFPMAIYSGYNGAQFQELLKLKDDMLAQKINAFKNGRVYVGGTFFQGPIYFLFQTEMAAKQIYPELFGPYRDDQKYPVEEQLFSRVELAKILREGQYDPEAKESVAKAASVIKSAETITKTVVLKDAEKSSGNNSSGNNSSAQNKSVGKNAPSSTPVAVAAPTL